LRHIFPTIREYFEMFFLIGYNFASDFGVSTNPQWKPKNRGFTCSFGFNINKSAYRHRILDDNPWDELVKGNPTCFEGTSWPHKSQLPSRCSRISRITLYLSSAFSWKMTLRVTMLESSNSLFLLFLFCAELSPQYCCKWWRMNVIWRSMIYIKQ